MKKKSNANWEVAVLLQNLSRDVMETIVQVETQKEAYFLARHYARRKGFACATIILDGSTYSIWVPAPERGVVSSREEREVFARRVFYCGGEYILLRQRN